MKYWTKRLKRTPILNEAINLRKKMLKKNHPAKILNYYSLVYFRHFRIVLRKLNFSRTCHVSVLSSFRISYNKSRTMTLLSSGLEGYSIVIKYWGLRHCLEAKGLHHWNPGLRVTSMKSRVKGYFVVIQDYGLLRCNPGLRVTLLKFRVKGYFVVIQD
jgi:hypothetical protein